MLGVVTLLIVVLVCGATTRLTRLMVDDRITLSFRQWALRRSGDGLLSYLVTCPWCVSPYVATVVAIPAVWWGCDFLPWHVRFVLSALLIPTASQVAGHLTKE